MSTTVKRNRIAIWSPKELKTRLTDTSKVLNQAKDGLKPIPHNPAYVASVKELAEEISEDVAKFIELYTETVDSMSVKRTSTLKPKLCDMKLTDFLSSVYGVDLPTMDKHGICDVNILAFRAISLYLKENRLTVSQFFTLDDRLHSLFSSPCVTEPGKSYLDLAKERIVELAAQRGSGKKTAATAEIIDSDGTVTMNHSALKIVVSKFVVDYDLVDTEKYTDSLNELNDVLQQRINALGK